MTSHSTGSSAHAPRRTFLQAVAGAVVAACSKSPPTKPQPGAPQPGDNPIAAGTTMPQRLLGRTGVTVSLVGLGGFHIGLAESDDVATKIVRTGIDRGVTFLDNCWDYNGGKSEVRMGNALQDGYRNKVFLMTKVRWRYHQDGVTKARFVTLPPPEREAQSPEPVYKEQGL